MSEGKPNASPKEKKTKSKEKKQRTGRKHESLKVWSYYEVSGGTLKRKREHCPRCGAGSFLSVHKDRNYCGRCGFTKISTGDSSARIEKKEPGNQKQESVEKEAKEETTRSEVTEQQKEEKTDDEEKKPEETSQ